MTRGERLPDSGHHRESEPEYQPPLGERLRDREAPDEGFRGVRVAAVVRAAERQDADRAQNAYAAEWLAVRLRRFRVLSPRAPLPASLADAAAPPQATPALFAPGLSRSVATIVGVVLRRLYRSKKGAVDPAVPPAAAAARPKRQYPPNDLSGIAFSGGGIRSATFCLGVLQSLGERRLLHMFDFLSTVSGGGYVGGWWSAWLSRRQQAALADDAGDPAEAPTLFPPNELLEPGRYQPLVIEPTLRVPNRVRVLPRAAGPDGSTSVTLKDPINHLRLFSNYLTPRTGLLSADTWRAVTVVVRNLSLTWLILLPLLLACVALGQLYFVANPDYVTPFVQTATPLVSPPPGARVASSAAAQTTLGPGAAGPGTAAAMSPQDAHVIDSTVRASTARAFTVVRSARLAYALRPAAVLLIWFGTLVLAWLLYSTGSIVGSTLIGLFALGLMISVLVPGLNIIHWPGAPSAAVPSARMPFWLTVGWIGALVLLVVFGLVLPLLDLGRSFQASVAEELQKAARPVGGASPPGLQELIRRAMRVAAEVNPSDAIRNRLVRVQATLLIATTGITLVVLAAGFSHELFATLFASGGTLPVAAAKAGGWGALLVSAISAVYAAVKTAPTMRGQGTVAQPGRLGSLILAIAPVLVVAALTIGFAALSHWLIATRGDTWTGVRPLARAASVGLILLMLFAVVESYAEREGGPLPPEKGWYSKLLNQLPELEADMPRVVGLGLGILVLVRYTPMRVGSAATTQLLGGWLAFTLVLVAFRHFTRKADDASVLTLGWRGKEPNDSALPMAPPDRDSRKASTARSTWTPVIWLVGASALVAAWIWLGPAIAEAASRSGSARTTDMDSQLIVGSTFGILVFVVTLMGSELVLGVGDRKRSTGLLTISALGAATLLIAYWLPSPAQTYATFTVALAITLVTGVLGLGWTIDPNLLSLHNFYRARLVRAYLGASNVANRRTQEITEAAPEDDIRLVDLQNANRGAPIHLINTTLNLVGGRDLTTAQRSAAPFVMSQLMCGSMRTGYRETARYMGGQLTLGTAIATSGAAVSPNMGSRTQSAALSLLMGLFNIRLGLWAPTPDKRRWREYQTRLWPLYLLRESLSQTNALGTFCYLTDGGHFDNTGIYSLVERACKCILLVDAGEDSLPCFADVGEAVRRCRIDFGAEIDLATGVAAFEKAKSEGLTLGHFVAGTVQYSDAHLRMLGYHPRQIPHARRGTIIWVRPAIAKDDSVDVRQYRIQKPPFPHQTTVDQWFDEAQFESYRALGYQSLSAVLDKMQERKHVAPLDVGAFFDFLTQQQAPPAAG